MDTFWGVVTCILLYPLICIACIFLPLFLMNIIGFFAKIVSYFKDEPTPPSSISPVKKVAPVEQSNKPIPSPSKLETPKQYVRTYTPSPPTKLEQKMKSQYTDEEIRIIKEKDLRKGKRVKTTVIVCLLLLFALLIGALALSSSDNGVIGMSGITETLDPHIHKYVKGQCECSALDVDYCSSIYSDIVQLMRSMDKPFESFAKIESKLKIIPEDYPGVKNISSQCFVLHNQCSIIFNESISEKPDYKKIQSALFTLLDKKTNANYRSWNVSAIINYFFDDTLHSKSSITWGLLYGYWESTSGYRFSNDGSYFTTNLPNPIAASSDFLYVAKGLKISVEDQTTGLSYESFCVFLVERDVISVYCYATNEYYRFSQKDPPPTSGNNSSTNKPTLYIGNRKTKVFHYSSCSYLPDINNRVYLGNRFLAIEKGYSPCEHCHP